MSRGFIRVTKNNYRGLPYTCRLILREVRDSFPQTIPRLYKEYKLDRVLLKLDKVPVAGKEEDLATSLVKLGFKVNVDTTQEEEQQARTVIFSLFDCLFLLACWSNLYFANKAKEPEYMNEASLITKALKSLLKDYRQGTHELNRDIDKSLSTCFISYQVYVVDSLTHKSIHSKKSDNTKELSKLYLGISNIIAEALGIPVPYKKAGRLNGIHKTNKK